MSDRFSESYISATKLRSTSKSAAPGLRESVIDQVARYIETLVRNGELSRGDRLPSEPRLAKLLNISRPSLREALKGMMFLGLLKARAGDGTYLQPSLTSMVSRHFQWMLLLKEIKYLELNELRIVLEPAAAAFAARRATHDDLDQMAAALRGMKNSTQDPESFIHCEMEFHGCIMQASKNAAIQTTMRMMYDALSEGRHRTMPLVKDIRQNCAKHERIFNLIASGDAIGARRALLADLKYAEVLLRKDLRNTPLTIPRLSPHRGRELHSASQFPGNGKVSTAIKRKTKKTTVKKSKGGTYAA